MANNPKFQLHEVLDPQYLQSLADQLTHIKSVQGISEEFNFVQFQNVMNAYTVPDISPNILKDIFTRLDFTCTGVSTWNSFLSYLQNEIDVKNRRILIGSNIEAAVSENIQIIYTGVHEDSICRIDTLPLNPFLASEKELGNQRYVTITREGTLAVWSHSWKLNKSTNINEPFSLFRKVKTLLLDMVSMSNVNLIGISGSDDCLRFFDSQNLDLLFILNGFVATVTTMNYWSDALEPELGVLLLGDNAGSVTIMQFTDCLVSSAFGPHPSKNRTQSISMNEIMNGTKPYIHVIKYKHLHGDWVKQVRYEPFLKAIMSCSATSRRSLVLIQQGLLAKGDWTFNVPHGINCFDFNADFNLLATGGIDRIIRIWNPHITNRPMMTFVGHSGPVHFLFFPDNHIFSISTDKVLKVWDMKDEKCIQNIPLINIPLGSSSISSAYHNIYKRILFIAANNVCIIKRLVRECDLLTNNVDVFASHPTAVTGIVYSKVYNQIVSVCQYGLITIWDLDSGHRLVQVQRAHFVVQNGVELPASVSAVCLDECGKRLITSGSDGYLKLWNLGSGCMLINSIAIPENQNILTLMSIKNYIFFAGWSRRIYSCDITQEAPKLNMWNIYHTDDIMSLSHLRKDTLVSCSWDGNICTWRIENELRQSFALSSFLSEQTFHLPSCVSHTTSRRSSKSLTSIHTLKSGALSFLPDQELRKPMISKSLSKSKGRILKPISKLDTTESRIACVCVLCLETRAVRPRVGNIFAADVMGRIQVWSSSSPPAALAVFASVMSEHHYTTCMATDSQNKYLITGDSNGFVRVWYIRYYCLDVFHLGTKQFIVQLTHPEVSRFPFCRRKLKAVADKAERKLECLTPHELSGNLTVDHPMLLSSYQAHVRAITGIILVETKEVIITSSSDQSVRLWTLHGRFIGIFGDPRDWDLIKLVTPPVKSKDRKIPGDVRRVSSATTLQVLFSGLSRRWWKIRELFLLNYMRAILRKQNKVTEPEKISAPVLAARKLSRKMIMESKYGPPLGKYFDLPRRTVPEPAQIIPEQMKKRLHVIHNLIPCYELENITIQKSQRIMNALASEKVKKSSRSITFSVLSKPSSSSS